MRKILCLVFPVLLWISSALAQTGVGQLPPWEIVGNPTALAAPPQATALGDILDGAFSCGTVANQLLRGASGWTCLSSKNVQLQGASGLDTTVNISTALTGATVLPLSAPWDMKVGQGVSIPTAGPANIAGTPVITSVVPTCGPTVTGTVAGTSVAGDTVSVIFGAPVTITKTYTIASGDNLAIVTAQLASLINNDATLPSTYHYLGSTNGGSSLIINYPNSDVAAITSSNVGGTTLTLGAPTGCTFTTGYKLIARDANGAHSASTGITNAVASSDPSALRPSFSIAKQNFNTINFTVGANTIDVILCRNNVPVAIVDAIDGLVQDWGQFNIATRDIPATCTVIAGNGPLISTITAVDNTVPSITIADPLVAGVTNQPIYHDDGVAIQNALSGACLSFRLKIPYGTYNTHRTLGCSAAGATFQGSITLTTLTVSSVTSGSLVTGQVVTGGTIATGVDTVITGQLTGPAGGAGTYSVSVSQSVGSAAMASAQIPGTWVPGMGPGTGFWLEGDGGNQRLGSNVGTIIKYWGRGDHGVLFYDRLSGSTFTDFHILANYYAKWGMTYDQNSACTPVCTGSSSGNIQERVSIYRVNSSADSAAMAIGHPGCGVPGTPQISEMIFNNIYYYVTDLGPQKAAFSVFCGGNVKNFLFNDYTMVGGQYGVLAASTSGNWGFYKGSIADMVNAAFSGTTILDVKSFEGENVNGAQLINVGGGGFPCTLSMDMMQWLTPAPAPENFAAEIGNCNITLSNSRFGSGTSNGEFRWNVAGQLEPPPTHPGQIISKNNFFEGSLTIPFWTGGNKISDITKFPNDNGLVVKPVGISSEGDYGEPTPNGYGLSGPLTRFEGTALTGDTRFIDSAYMRQWITNKPVNPTAFIDLYGSSLRSQAWPTPTAPTVVVNTAGAVTCTYQVAFRDASGAHTTPLSASTTHVTMCATPANNTISSAAPAGAWFMDVIDTVSGMLVGTVNVTQFAGATFSLTDTGKAQSAYSPPSPRNNTGEIQAGGQITAAAYATSAPVTTACPSANTYAVTTTDAYLIANDAAATCTVTLLTASQYTGRSLTIKTTQAQTVVSATTNVVPLVGGAAAAAILAATAGKWAKLVSDGTNWIIMEGN